MQRVTGSMSGIVKTMGKAMESMNLEQISRTMDAFEKQFEDLDVQSGYVESAMSQSTATATPQEEVEALMQKVADENGLDLKLQLAPGSASLASSSAVKEQDDLAARLNALKAR
eukprot:TRINITY_DN3717_c0_g1_i1.p4 TRINITY_DN3717_c0_g1~~TRINITY_DN3717_c0_g1_i1.p4  ORF type:complete len:114 (+),score=29.08 TRINITY_DN3717_c0_g1_i1:345-686(+)